MDFGTSAPSSADVEIAGKKAKRRPLYKSLGFQLMLAILLGVTLGHFYPSFAQEMKPLGYGFIKLVKMLIAPIIFCLVVHGIASVGSVKQVGRIGLKSLIYFEILTTVALVLGVVGMDIFRPGVGMNVDVTTIDSSSLSSISGSVKKMGGVTDYFLHIIPDTFVGAFSEGQILQVLFMAILFAFALNALGERGKPLVQVIDLAAQCFFGAINYVMKVAPIGAFGAMAFTVGRYGIGSLGSLAYLVAVYYIVAVFFLVACLGTVSWIAGFNLFSFMRYLKDEILLVFGTSSSEAALPRLMAKLESLGVPKSVVGLVVPTGYTFNQDGTCINLTVLAMFVAQATNTHLSLGATLGLLAVLLLTSKGAAAVTGGSLVVLTATLASTHIIPVAGVAIILGIYQFISIGGAIVNMLGNGVAAVVVARWEGAIDMKQFRVRLRESRNSQ
ncbi:MULTISPECIES: C4-dicarboxylate transporter DctA [unclassified Caballeronia]|uniref:C4-dicarboxylate transporter DctA n=1 Tax=unclassified Caballeronia TaxID=2646786 RepID=UPI0020285F0A|nr:C4-dicarboxylate transporter DctA [Caballeronia sp. LZ028]MDR5765865.1 C4-dicarboxylate transporter DctA [Caballeronia sp. LZ028]